MFQHILRPFSGMLIIIINKQPNKQTYYKGRHMKVKYGDLLHLLVHDHQDPPVCSQASSQMKKVTEKETRGQNTDALGRHF